MSDNSMTLVDDSRGGDASVGDYFDLLKPRVMSLVVFTAVTGLMLAPGQIHPLLGAVAILCIAVAAGASGAINMWYDADIDAAMSRTAKRPIPRGAVAPGEALGFGLGLTGISVLLMGVLVNWLAAALLAFTVAFYIIVYTIWLKRRTPQNIVIGGAAGALPPLIAWAAVSGDITWGGLALFAIIFIWTPPHFWALALYREGDYARAGVPMLPVVAGRRNTKQQILIYTILMLPLTLAPWFLGISGVYYAVGAVAAGLPFLVFALRLWRTADDQDKDEKPARDLFAYSILYLFLLFAMMLAERLLAPVL
jgi:protoheme IX farnesyltransferase